MINAQKVKEFMVTFGQTIDGTMDGMTLLEFITFRRRLSEEELNEMDEAAENNDRVEMLDAGIDSLYFNYGTLIGLGFTPEQIYNAFDEVHRSNMSKLGTDGKPIRREDGKILKGPNYFKPDLTKFV